ncbi:transcriptional regulator, IclR family [Variovorax sp. PDC80]|jgi:DNA-binding IclR family transcriptional regulator|uniref:IclR family transcriptional regulator n=1 Tax=Variovorax sp. PDC80 TaxID=1882827 RepID=UPI0008F3DE44|nr:IclR family transcriptional regulator [Variovorax sp. PDC80]SFO04342.1 transcriptional regulator, IclR family [Variovorax sp. PDC80]
MASTPKKKAPAAKPKAAAAKLPAAPAPRERRQRVQSAETGMAVLKGLARMGGNAGLSGLAAHVGESPAKVHRYLASLVQEGLVAQDVDSQRYRLGPEAINIGLAAMRQSDPVRAAEPALVRLREGLEVTCFVAVMGNKGPTVMRFEEPGLPVTVNVRAGSVMSMLWSATGRAFLGLLNERSVRELAEQELAAAPREMRAQLDAKQPIEALRAEVRALRCAVVRDTYLRGISAVAAPVHDFTGRVCAVITALGASGGFDPSADGEIATAVLREAAATSEVLGYLVPKEC